MPDARLLASATALLGAGAVGLGIPAPTPRIQTTDGPAEYTAPNPEWPDGLLRWLDVASRGLVPVATTATFAASGRIRLGRSPWLPVSYQTFHDLGHGFKAELSATWYGKSYVRAIDGFSDGRGVSNVRDQTVLGPGLDQGAVPFLWSEAILIPSTWGLPGVTITQPSETELSVKIAEDSPVAGPLDATIDLDPETGLPTRFSVPWRAKDHENRSGAGWSVDYTEWQPSAGGASVRLAQVNWADDSRPWLRLRLEAPALGVDITDAMADIRSLIADAESAIADE